MPETSRLVLTRKLNESILIGDDIRIVFAGKKGDRGKFVIEAPRNVRILRDELRDHKRN